MVSRESVFCVTSMAAALVLGGICSLRIVQSRAAEQRIPPAILLAATQGEIQGQATALGPPNAPYTLVEFGDYQCPPCARLHKALKEWLPMTQGKVRFLFRNYPLNIHPYAYSAAVAAEAAGEQGHFWEMHDYLYDNHNNLSSDVILTEAKHLHLDLERFHRAQKMAAKKRVEADLQQATKVFKVNGTPTLILCSPNHITEVMNLPDLYKRFPTH